MHDATWPDGTPKSQNNGFTGCTGMPPIVWATPAQISYATRFNAGFNTGKTLDVAGRPTVSIGRNPSGLSIATPDDKKFKRLKKAAI